MNIIKRLPKTQYRIAQECGVSRQAVFQWLRGDTVPTDKNMVRLCLSLDMTGEQVFELIEYNRSRLINSDSSESEMVE